VLDDIAEAWLPVLGYEGTYEVSSLGRVRSQPRPRTKGGIKKANPCKRGGYPKVSLCRAGRERSVLVHCIVAEAFIGPRPAGAEIRHLDGNPWNCAADNLRYGTKSENGLDTVRHGTHKNTRKTHCPSGHRYDEANTRWYRRSRYCRACEARRKRSADHPDYRAEWCQEMS
jgi:hypothetical protein